MLKIWFYITGVIKYFIFLIIVTAILAYIFPIAAFIVFIIGIFTINGLAKDNVTEKYNEHLQKVEQKRLLRVAENSKDEFDGFEDALTLTRRSMS